MGGASHNVLLRTGLFHWSLCHAPQGAWNILRVPWCFEQMAGIQFINCRVTLPTRSKDCGIVKENVQHYPEDPHPTSECFSNIWRALPDFHVTEVQQCGRKSLEGDLAFPLKCKQQLVLGRRKVESHLRTKEKWKVQPPTIPSAAVR